MTEECQVHHKKLPCEECKAEKQKKIELYDPDTCPDQGETGCTYPDCDNCEVDYCDIDNTF